MWRQAQVLGTPVFWAKFPLRMGLGSHHRMSSRFLRRDDDSGPRQDVVGHAQLFLWAMNAEIRA